MKYTKNDYIEYFHAATDPNTNVYPDDFRDMNKKFWGDTDIPQDVSLALGMYKSKSNGGELFADYILKKRSKGDYAFPIQPKFRTPLNHPVKESLLKNLIREILMELKK